MPPGSFFNRGIEQSGNDTMRYDLIVIGSGASGQEGAIAAAKRNKRVAIVEPGSQTLPGDCLHGKTIPFKTIREAILHLTGDRRRDGYGEGDRHDRPITMEEFRRAVALVAQNQYDIVRDELNRNGVDVYVGTARFVSPHQVAIGAEAGHDGRSMRSSVLQADNVLIATGTKPARPTNIRFDGRRVFDADDFLSLEKIPDSIIVVGGGIVGIEYALMLSAIGVRVTVVDGREHLLEFCDREVVDSLLYHARALGTVFRLGDAVIGVDRLGDDRAVVHLESGKRLIGESVLFSVGRFGATEDLNLPTAGVEVDECGRLWCNEHHQTWVPHIYGVGDVVGYPSLAGVSMEQGRRAVDWMFGHPLDTDEPASCSLFTIPEIAMVGPTEEQLTAERVPYELGTACFQESTYESVSGDPMGMLKLLFHRETRKLLAIHCIGKSAAQIVRSGQAVMAHGGTIDAFRDTVAIESEMAGCYKEAACDGLSKLLLDGNTEFVPHALDESLTDLETVTSVWA